MKLTAEEIMRYGAETEREQTLIDKIIDVEASLKDIENASCPDCDDAYQLMIDAEHECAELEEEIERLKDILRAKNISHE